MQYFVSTHADSRGIGHGVVFEKTQASSRAISVLVFVGGVIGLAVVVGLLYQPIGRKILLQNRHTLQARIDLRENTQEYSYPGHDPGSICIRSR